jgi:hypothetical protein
MRIITHSADIRSSLDQIKMNSEPPYIAPARGPLLWEDGDTQVGEGTQVEPDWALAAQSQPECDVDQRANW